MGGIRATLRDTKVKRPQGVWRVTKFASFPSHYGVARATFGKRETPHPRPRGHSCLPGGAHGFSTISSPALRPPHPRAAPRSGPHLPSPFLPGEVCVVCTRAPVHTLRGAISAALPGTGFGQSPRGAAIGYAVSPKHNGTPLGRRQVWRFRLFRDLRARRKQGQ